jgi:hypothetical protein
MDTKWIQQSNFRDRLFKKNFQEYQDAPEPKIVKIDFETPVSGNSLHYEVAVVFDTTTFRMPNSFERFNPKNHSCIIYRWDPKIKIEFSVGSGYYSPNNNFIPTKIFEFPDGVYYAWLQHKRSLPTKWKKFNKKKKYHFMDRLVSAHLFFKTEEDFKNWMGDKHYALMFTDLI